MVSGQPLASGELTQYLWIFVFGPAGTVSARVQLLYNEAVAVTALAALTIITMAVTVTATLAMAAIPVTLIATALTETIITTVNELATIT